MKNHLLKLKGFETKWTMVKKGVFGLKVLEGGRLRLEEIEAASKAIKKVLKKVGELYLTLKAEYGYTKKPLEVRMGKGKGNIAGYEAIIKRGKILFEIFGVSELVALRALEQGKKKIKLKSSIINFKI